MKKTQRAMSILLWLAVWLCPALAQGEEARRVIVAGGALTEIVYALGLADRLVGVDITSSFPPETEKLPKIGYLRNLGSEGLLSLRPDLVLAIAEAGPPEALAQIRAAGTRVEIVATPNTPEGGAQKIIAVADALGVSALGRELEQSYRAAWQATQQAVAGYQDRPRVLFILAHTGGNPMVAGRDTAADAMIRLAGADNAGAGFEGYKPMSAEAIMAANPEVLLITTEGVDVLGGLDPLWDHPALRLTPAGHAHRIVTLDSLYLLGFGPRLPDAVQELARRLRTPETE